MNNISFQGKTNLFLNPKNFSKSIDKIKSQYHYLDSSSRATLNNGQKYATSPDSGNLAVVVRNDKKGFLRYIPTTHNPSPKLLEEISRKKEELLKNAKSKLTVWIIGGGNLDGKNGKGTIEALNKVANILCDKPNIDASILVGSKTQENIILHAIEDGLEITLEKSPKSNLDDLFDIVELNNTEIM